MGENTGVGDFRVYTADELGDDGYPLAWHGLGDQDPFALKRLVRGGAGHRCVRCQHPFMTKADARILGLPPTPGRWSPCDERCSHGMPARDLAHPFSSLGGNTTTGALIREAREQGVERVIEAKWRVLTVHHLGEKSDCRWFMLVALCQRCHLTIQGRVVMERAFILEHSEWFKVFAAGWYAWKYEGREITREEAEARLDELLAYERLA